MLFIYLYSNFLVGPRVSSAQVHELGSDWQIISKTKHQTENVTIGSNDDSNMTIKKNLQTR